MHSNMKATLGKRGDAQHADWEFLEKKLLTRAALGSDLLFHAVRIPT